MSVRFGTSTEVMATHNACESAAFTGTGDVYKLLVLKDVNQNLVTDFHLAIGFSCGVLTLRLLLTGFHWCGHRDLFHELHRRQVVLLKCPCIGLVTREPF